MIASSSSFIATSLALSHNAVKSIIFRAAEILMGIFVFKLFSLIAARSNKFTSYIMFAEGYIQRLLFVSSRGLSGASIIVLLFTILNMVASLYGTSLWALDSPGYVLKKSNRTVAEYQNLRNQDPPYVVQLHLDRDNLQSADETLVQAMGADFFKPGFNFSLTGEVQRGSPETTKPTQRDADQARIWLDDQGFSVSADSYVMLPDALNKSGKIFPSKCIEWGGGSTSWSCKFDNAFSFWMAQQVIGKPEVHWDDESSKREDTRYINPNRENNIWSSFGKGSGSVAMKQFFTVTKGTRRHTFVESVFRSTMLRKPSELIATQDLDDLVQRTWSVNGQGIDGFLPDKIVEEMLRAQNGSYSYSAGVNMANNGGLSVLQSTWGFLTLDAVDTTLIILTSTNITLIRSETITKALEPLEPCSQGSYQNEAFGGKVTQTDCEDSQVIFGPRKFFGQVDTGAILIVYGLGNSRSKSSFTSLDNKVFNWTQHMSTRMDNLLIARGFIVSVDPALVTITVEKLIVGISILQLFLSLLTVILAGASWTWLAFCTNAPWSNTFFANLVHTTLGNPKKLGYISSPPSIALSLHETQNLITVSGRAVVLQDGPMVPMNVFSQGQTVGYVQVAGFETVPPQGKA